MTDHYKKELLSIIHKYLPDCIVYLFGSRARKTHQQGSDIDLALDDGGEIDLDILVNIKADIHETVIPLFVDIVDMYSVANALKEEIIKDGIKWTD